MAHAIRGGEHRRHPLILFRAILFWSAFATLGIGCGYAIDRAVMFSADLASLTLPNDAQLAGSWISGPLRLQNNLQDRTMIVELWRTEPHRRQIASFGLKRGAKQGPIGFRHRFADADGDIAVSLSGSVLTLELPASDGQPARRLAFRRP